LKQITLTPVFVKTANVRNFTVLMDALSMAAGEGRLGLVYGRAGRGKTRTAQWYAANNEAVYLRAVTCWATSELAFMQGLARELGIINPPHRKGPCFAEVVDALLTNPRPVFVDEIEKLSARFLDLVRDLSDISTAPFILVGEEELVPAMKRNRRVWSRTYQQIEFKPVGIADLVAYAGSAASLKLSGPVAEIFHKASGGDFRLIRRDILSLVQIANAKGTTEVDPDMARTAVTYGLAGR
jgi:DNA transposition AAA+ family ATPase